MPSKKLTGPCPFCGDPDGSHRIRDAITGAYQAGETPETIAAELKLPLETVKEVISHAS